MTVKLESNLHVGPVDIFPISFYIGRRLATTFYILFE